MKSIKKLEALLKYETITADEIDFLVKYGSLDAYDVYKQNSEELAKHKKSVETKVEESVTSEEVKDETNE